jgi:hypothetical protein
MKQFFKYSSLLAFLKHTLKNKTEKNKNHHFPHRKVNRVSATSGKEFLQILCKRNVFYMIPKANANKE